MNQSVSCQCISQTTVPVCHRQQTPKKIGGPSPSSSRETGCASATQITLSGLGYLGWALGGPSGRSWGSSCVEPEEESRSAVQASGGFQSTCSQRYVKGDGEIQCYRATWRYAIFKSPHFHGEIFWGCRNQSRLKMWAFAMQLGTPYLSLLLPDTELDEEPSGMGRLFPS